MADIIVDDSPAPMEVDDLPNVSDRESPLPSSYFVPRRTVIRLYTLASHAKFATLTHTITDEAYAAKAMPDLGLEIADFQAQTWRIEKWSQQPKRLVGPEFSCGGHKW